MSSTLEGNCTVSDHAPSGVIVCMQYSNLQNLPIIRNQSKNIRLFFRVHHSGIPLESRHFKSPATRLFVQQLVLADNTGNNKAPPCGGECNVNGRFSSQRASYVSMSWCHHAHCTVSHQCSYLRYYLAVVIPPLSRYSNEEVGQDKCNFCKDCATYDTYTAKIRMPFCSHDSIVISY